MASVESLSILITASTKQAKDKVDALVESLNRLVAAIDLIDTSKFTALSAAADSLSQSMSGISSETAKDLENIAKSLKDISVNKDAFEPIKQGAQGVVEETKAVSESAEQIDADLRDIDKATLEEVAASADKVSTNITKTSSKMSMFKSLLSNLKIIVPTEGLDRVNKRIEKLSNKIQDLKHKLEYNSQTNPDYVDSKEMEKDQAQIQGLINELDRLKLKKQELESHGGFKFNNFGAGLQGISNTVSRLNRQFVGLISRLFKVRTATHSTTKATHNFKLSADRLFKSLTKVTRMLRLMILRMALRTVIREVGNGFKSLALHSDEFNSAMSSLINSSKKLGYSFAGMVGPLINALAPALLYIINLLTRLANAINQIFSAFTGKGTWNKAKDFTNNWAEDIAAANKNAKELKKTVLGFDELNQLQAKNDSSGGGGNDITDMFETVPIDSKWKDIADWLKKMWELGDFYELGKKLGEKLRDMLESIPWDLIRKTANKLGKSLATLINGFVEVERLGYDIGYTIAQSVNTVFEFLNGFVHNLHWDSIGRFIADTFNGFFENIDWQLIKDTVVTGMAGVAEAIQTFINDFHWDNISDFVVNAIDTITSGIKAFVEGIDWGDLGVKIGDQLNKIMRGVDWKSVGETLGEVLEAAIDWAYGLVTTFSVDDAVKALSDFLKGVCEKVDGSKAGEALGTALHKIIETIQKFWWNAENRRMVKDEIIGFFRGIFETMTESDFKFIASTAGALALLAAIKGILTKNALQLTITVAVAYFGFKLGSWIGKILTDDPAYTEYDIDAVLKWTVENFPTTIEEAIERIKELKQAWYDMIYEMDNVFTKIMGIATLISNPSSWPQFLGRFAKDHNWEGIGADLNAGSGAGPSDTEWQKTIEAANEATEKVIEYKHEVGTIPEAWSGAGSGDAEWGAVKDMAQQSQKAAQDASGSVRNYRTEVEGLTEKQKQLKGIMSPLVDDTNKLKTNTDNLATANNNLKSNSERLNQVINNANTAYKNYKAGMENNVNYTPKFTSSMQDINNHLGELAKGSEDFEVTNKKVWSDYELETANASTSFAGTAHEIQKNMDDTAEDIKKQTGDITKSFSKDKWTFSGVWEGLKYTFEKAKEGIKGIWNSIADKVNGRHEIAGKSFEIDWPKFASGGFPEDGFFYANSNELVGRFDNGRTAVANNEQIISGIQTGVYNAVSAAMSRNGNGNGYIANTIVVDGEVIARTVTKAQQKQNMRYSPVMG